MPGTYIAVEILIERRCAIVRDMASVVNGNLGSIIELIESLLDNATEQSSTGILERADVIGAETLVTHIVAINDAIAALTGNN